MATNKEAGWLQKTLLHSSEQRRIWQEASNAEGLPMSLWMRRTLDAEARRLRIK